MVDINTLRVGNYVKDINTTRIYVVEAINTQKRLITCGYLDDKCIVRLFDCPPQYLEDPNAHLDLGGIY